MLAEPPSDPEPFDPRGRCARCLGEGGTQKGPADAPARSGRINGAHSGANSAWLTFATLRRATSASSHSEMPRSRLMKSHISLRTTTDECRPTSLGGVSHAANSFICSSP